MAEPVTHGRQDVVDVVVGAQPVQRDKPAVGAPDRRFVHADGHDVELAALGGDVGGDALAQHVFLERDPLDTDAGLCGELIGVALHPDHIAVVHSCDGYRGVLGKACARNDGKRRRGAKYALHRHP